MKARNKSGADCEERNHKNKRKYSSIGHYFAEDEKIRKRRKEGRRSLKRELKGENEGENKKGGRKMRKIIVSFVILKTGRNQERRRGKKRNGRLQGQCSTMHRE